MTDREPVHTPAPDDVVARVEGELRQGWWSTTLLTAVPIVVAVLIGYVVLLEVLDGDWLALLFPGVIALLSGWIGLRLLTRTITVKSREGRLAADDRRQAVYVRGLSGTHRLAAAQHRDGFAVLDPIWRPWTGTVQEVRTVHEARGRRTVEVDVRHPSGRTVTALLTTPADHSPSPGTRCRVLEDPHHDRAVVDLRRARRGASR